MADNTLLDAGSGGDTVVTREISHAGDTAKLPGSFLMGITGTEGAYTAAAINGDATYGLDVDVTRLPAPLTVTGGGVESSALRVTIASDSTGVLSVDDNGASLTVDNAGVFAVQVDGSALTALQLIDDTIFADDAAFTLASSKVSMAGAIRDDALATLTAVEGDAVPLRVDSTGALWTVITGTVTVGSHAVTNAGTFAVQAAQSGTWNIGTVTTVSTVTSITNSVTVVGGAASGAAVSGNPVRIGGKTSGGTTYDIITDSDGELIVHQKAAATSLADDANAPLVVPVSENQSAVMYTPTVPYVFDGTSYDRLRGTSADGLLVNLGSNNDVTVTGTVSGTGTAGSAASGVVTIQGVASMTPVQIGDNSSSITVDATTTAPLPVYLIDAAGGQTCMDTTNDALRVNVVAGGGSGGTSATDDAAFTAASGSFTPVGGIVTADSVDSGDGGAFAMLANRQQKVTLYDSGGVEVSVGGGTQYDEDTASTAGEKLTMAGVVRQDTPASLVGTDGDRTVLIVGATGRVWTSTTIDAALPAGTNAIGKLAANSGVDIGDVDVTSVPADPFGANADAASATGSISAKLRFIASTGIPITGTVTVGSHAVTNAGTFAVQVDGSALTSLQLIDDAIYSDDAAFTPATSKVAAIGFQADETSPDSVDEGDVGCPRMTLDRQVRTVAERDGDYIYIGGAQVQVKRIKIDAASSGENTLVAAVASKKIRVISMALVSAGTVSLYLNNATDGAIFGGSTNKIALVANTGFVLPPNEHGWCQTGTNNEALRINLSAAIAVAGSLTYCEV